MENQRKWAGAIIIGVAAILVAAVFLVTNRDNETNVPNQPPKTVTSSASTANASAIGYAGPVLVRLSLRQDGVVEAIDIGGARLMETKGLGSRVREEEFTSQFVGKTPPFALGENIEAIAGATYSSQAAVDAANDAAAFLAQ